MITVGAVLTFFLTLTFLSGIVGVILFYIGPYVPRKYREFHANLTAFIIAVVGVLSLFFSIFTGIAYITT